MPGEKSRKTVSVAEERVHVERSAVETGRVRLDKTVDREPVDIDARLTADELAIERVAINRVVDQPAGTRTEGDVTIIPVYEERIVKQLVLVEEIHVRRVREERPHRERVERRVERVKVSRQEPSGSDNPGHDGG